MKKAFLGSLLFTVTIGVQAMETNVSLGDADADAFDRQSVKRGAAHYVSYCMGCHSVKHLRYSRIASDLKLKEQDLHGTVLLGDLKFQDSLLSAMDKEDSLQWFGVQPPDLSLIARARGADWLYSYLKGFYADPTRPYGSNNVMFPDVGMPNVLWQLQGTQKAVHKKVGGSQVIERLELTDKGTMTPKEFDRLVNDLVNFLLYAGEPSQYQRIPMGKYVLLGLIALTVLFFKLKKAYWKDIH